MTVRLKSENSNLQVTNKSALQQPSNPCGTEQIFYLVPEKDLKKVDNKVILESTEDRPPSLVTEKPATIEGTISKYREVIGPDNKTWICAD